MTKYEVEAMSFDARICSSFSSGNRITAIVSASWEKRSSAVLSVLGGLLIAEIVVLRFANRGRTGISGNVRRLFRDFARQRHIPYTELEIDSGGLTPYNLTNLCYKLSDRVGRNDAIIDITSIPRLIWTSLCFLWHRVNSVRRVHFFYARPIYVLDENPKRDLIYDYTQGEWRLVDTAFRKSTFGGGLFKSNIISVGYEYDNVKKLVYRLEGDSNYILYANPGFHHSYTLMAERTISKLKTVFELPDDRFLSFAVNDVPRIMQGMHHIIAKLRTNTITEINLICAGSKLHTLGLMICALENDDLRLQIRTPAGYKERPTEWDSGMVDLVTLENVFCPL